MSYQEKRNVMSVVVGVIILGVYGIYAYGRYQSGAIGAEDLTAWAQIMLVFAGIMVAAQIAAHVILHIMLAVGLSVKETVDKGYSDGSAVE